MGVLSWGAGTARGAVETFGWNSAVEEASKGNPEIRAAQETLLSAENASRAAYSGFLPSVSANLGYSKNGNSLPGGAENSSENYNATLSASQNLFTGLSDKARVDQAIANVRLEEALLTRTQAKVSADLKTAYATLLFSQRSAKLQAEIARRRQDNLRLVELRFQSGRENKGSVLLSRAYLNQARYEELQAQHSIPVSQADFARVLGRDESSDLNLLEEVPTEEPKPQIDFRDLALSTPAHRESAAKESSAEAGVVLARSFFFPTLGLTGSTGRRDDHWFPERREWTVGVNLTLPLFSGGKDYFLTRGALATYRASQSTSLNIDRETLAELKKNHADLVEAFEKIKVDESFLEAAKTRAEIGRNKYNNGLITFENWDLIENDLILRQKNALQSRRDLVIAAAAWERTQGKGVLLGK